jgi:uncharacterized DUF497 family protein
MHVTYNHRNLAQHGITPEQVDEVATAPMTIECEMSPSVQGNQRIMLVGFTSCGRLLEVGIEFFHYESRIHFFHATDANKHYKLEFERRTSP